MAYMALNDAGQGRGVDQVIDPGVGVVGQSPQAVGLGVVVLPAQRAEVDGDGAAAVARATTPATSMRLMWCVSP